MSHQTEADAIIEAAQQAVGVDTLHDSGIFYDSLHGEVVDIRRKLAEDRAHPTRKVGTYIVKDADSFVEYVTKHRLDETEFWASERQGTIQAVFDAHGISHAGWGEHKATLQLTPDKDWLAWKDMDGQLVSQTLFAEFIEDHLHNFVEPKAADMLELAQTFQAKIDFESSNRVKSGETQLQYVHSATAGRKGNLTIPDTFTVGLQPFEGSSAMYPLTARFRYRITGQELRIGYKLVRPDQVVKAAFDEIAQTVENTLEATLLRH